MKFLQSYCASIWPFQTLVIHQNDQAPSPNSCCDVAVLNLANLERNMKHYFENAAYKHFSIYMFIEVNLGDSSEQNEEAGYDGWLPGRYHQLQQYTHPDTPAHQT